MILGKFRTLNVTWTARPIATPARWWDVPHLELKPDPMEPSLGLPLGTLQILNKAFQQGLDRFTGWRIPSGVSEDLQRAASAAATLYKRGVTCSPRHTRNNPAETSGSHDIQCFEGIPNALTQPRAGTFTVVDRTLKSHYDWTQGLPEQQYVDAHETSKNLNQVARILDAWRLAGKPRHWVIIGGGITLDLCALAAAHAECTFTLVPTTLLAMIDACIGGKTGVNLHPFGKNQIGRFAFPNAVWIYPSFVNTQSLRDFRSGIAECLKHALLMGDHSLGMAWLDLSKHRPSDMEPHIELILQTLSIKHAVIQQDAMERDVRAVLNLGHTLAHALETLAESANIADRTRITHGEAVAIGLYFALVLSQVCNPQLSDELNIWQQRLRQARILLPLDQWSTRIGQELTNGLLTVIFSQVIHDKKFLSNSETDKQSRWVILNGTKTEWGANLVEIHYPILETAWRQFVKVYSEENAT